MVLIVFMSIFVLHYPSITLSMIQLVILRNQLEHPDMMITISTISEDQSTQQHIVDK